MPIILLGGQICNSAACNNQTPCFLCLRVSSWCVSSLCVLLTGVKFVHWPSSPSQTCRFIPKRTQRQRLTSVLTALSPLRTHHTWPSTCAYTWASNLTAAPTVRNVFASSPICSSTPGLISTLITACSWWHWFYFIVIHQTVTSTSVDMHIVSALRNNPQTSLRHHLQETLWKLLTVWIYLTLSSEEESLLYLAKITLIQILKDININILLFVIKTISQNYRIRLQLLHLTETMFSLVFV